MISERNPFFSAPLRYILRRISAQSWDSVPPAPGCMAMMALLWSLGPESIRRSSISFTSSDSLISSPSTSRATPSSFSSRAISYRPLASSREELHLFHPSMACWRPVCSFKNFWAGSLSSPKPGLEKIEPSSISRCSLDSMSKMPPQGFNLPFKFFKLFLQIDRHMSYSFLGLRIRGLRGKLILTPIILTPLFFHLNSNLYLISAPRSPDWLAPKLLHPPMTERFLYSLYSNWASCSPAPDRLLEYMTRTSSDISFPTVSLGSVVPVALE